MTHFFELKMILHIQRHSRNGKFYWVNPIPEYKHCLYRQISRTDKENYQRSTGQSKRKELIWRK